MEATAAAQFSADDAPTETSKSEGETLQNGFLLKPIKTSNDVVRFTDSSSSSSSASSSSSSSDESCPQPPDGGFGWIVVFASFIAHMIADGCSISVGVFFDDLLEEFGQSKASTAWVGSLLVSMPAICGPIASIVTNRFGCRRTTIAGGIIAAFGCILASFANSVGMLCVTFGVITGFGLSLVFVPAVVIVAYYFETKRALATGIAVAGTGVGAFIFAPLTDYLIEVYTLRGALVIIGAIMLNIVVCGALYRPLESFKQQRKRRRYLRSLERFSRVSSRRTSGEALDHSSTCDHDPDDKEAAAGCELCNDLEPISHSLILFPTYLQNGFFPEDMLSPELLHHTRRGTHGSQSLRNLPAAMAVSIIDEKPIAHICSPKALPANGDCSSPIGIPNGILKGFDESSRKKRTKHPKKDRCPKSPRFPEHFVPRSRRDIVYRGSLLKAGALLSTRHSASCPDIFIHSRRRKQSEGICSRIRSYFPGLIPLLRDSIDVSIFRSPIFILFCIHSMFLYLSYDIPYMYLPDHAGKIDIEDPYASFLISIIGIASTVGQVVIGYIGDLPTVNRVHFYIAMTFIAGVATIFVPLLLTFVGLAIYSAIYGFFISANFTLTTIIVVELLGMDQLTNAYGFVSLAEGLANLVGVPIAGWLTDTTDSYNLSFFASGTVICCSALLLLLVPCLRRCDPIVHLEDKSDVKSIADSESSSDNDDNDPTEITCQKSVKENCETPATKYTVDNE